MALGSLSYGYASSIIATTLGQPTFLSYFALDTRPNANDLMGAINGLFQAGGFLGTLGCYAIADHFGRRKAILVAALISTIGGALQAGSVDIGMFIAMRFLTGVGIGMLTEENIPRSRETNSSQGLWLPWFRFIKVKCRHQIFADFWSASMVA